MAHNLFFKTPTNKGLTYIEILAGIAIISFIIVGMNSIFSIGIRNNKKAENIVIALNEAQRLMEQELAKDFGEQKSHDKVVVIDVSEEEKKIVVTVPGPDITSVELICASADPKVKKP